MRGTHGYGTSKASQCTGKNRTVLFRRQHLIRILRPPSGDPRRVISFKVLREERTRSYDILGAEVLRTHILSYPYRLFQAHYVPTSDGLHHTIPW